MGFFHHNDIIKTRKSLVCLIYQDGNRSTKLCLCNHVSYDFVKIKKKKINKIK